MDHLDLWGNIVLIFLSRVPKLIDFLTSTIFLPDLLARFL